MANEPGIQSTDLNDADLAARTQAQAQASLPQPTVQNPWEDQPELPTDHPFFGLRVKPLDDAYKSARSKVNEWEDSANKNIVQPFRQGLDNIGTDLTDAAQSGHTKSGGVLNNPTRAVLGGVGTALKFAPVGNTVRETAQMAVIPGLPEGHLFEGLRVIPSAPMAEEEAAALRNFTGKQLESENELQTARKAKAEYDANQALAKRQLNTDPKANVPSKNRNRTEIADSPVTEHKPATRPSEPSQPLSEEEKQSLRKSTGRDLHTDEDFINARKSQAEWDSNEALKQGKTTGDPKANVPSKNRATDKKPASAKEVVEGQGLVYKGELSPGSGVHMFEHPSHPGKTAAIKEPISPEAIKTKMDSKLKEFGVSVQPMSFGDDAKAQAVNSLGKKSGIQRHYKTRDREARQPLLPSDKKTLTPDYLLRHKNEFDGNDISPDEMWEMKFGKKAVTKT